MVATGEPFVPGTSQPDSQNHSAPAADTQPTVTQMISDRLTEEEERDNYLWGV